MSLKVRVNNLNSRKRIDKTAVKKAALSVMRGFKKKNVAADITFVTDKKITQLNKKYMKRNKPTDVLSFLMTEKTFPEQAIFGDIYISSDMAAANALSFNNSFGGEIALYVIHGVLHMLGFRDKTSKEKKVMRGLEEKFLKKTWKSKL